LIKFTTDFDAVVDSAVRLAKSTEADAILLLIDDATEWVKLRKKTQDYLLIVASNKKDLLEKAKEAELETVALDLSDSPIHDRLGQAILDCVADEFVPPGSKFVALYSGFDVERIDSISVIQLSEHLGRLTARDLQKLETNVPLDTLKVVVDLAIEIGREGREGKPVGTMFIVGDHRKVLDESRPAGFDFVKGYPRKDRSIFDSRVREGVKEIAQLDGAFIVSADGTVEASGRLVDTNPVEITMTTGLGARHFAGAAISKNTKAISVVISESNGTVRIFQNGEVVLRIEPFRRAMKWKDFGPESGESKPTPEN
jgi:diadenylate cyclase